ncbi:general stress protein [Paenisporosarcina cavernae]|uniref:General stress protein n=1 Tax=Paenisporosarcina cavernae TaxID=2320858 RepID=A0A385YXV9_9BACL|nr:general stress protein [Paenisporosarcina cavernae]AYC30428.1 general stress protein [Paenisporosarcina cavernae]
MTVHYKEYVSDAEAIRGIQEIKTKGVHENDIYVLTHEDRRTDDVAEAADANTVGMEETGFGTAMANVFRKKGDELRSQFQELGFSQPEAERLEEKLDQNKVVVVVKNPPTNFTM